MKKLLLLLIALMILLVFGCQTYVPEIDQTDQRFSPYHRGRTCKETKNSSYDNLGTLIFEEISEDEFEILIKKIYESIVEIYKDHGVQYISDFHPNQEYGHYFHFGTNKSIYDGEVSYALDYAYDDLYASGYIKLHRQLNRKNGTGTYIIKDFPYDRLISKILDHPELSFNKYKLNLKYTAQNRIGEGSTDGLIVIEVILDINSQIEIGGLKTNTDDQGKFWFAGIPSLARISEGVITIVADSEAEVLVYQNTETKKWYVQVKGQKAGKTVEFPIEVDSLNY